ncbi:hypothetical protein BJF89_16935 [Corynebacterium sp. CNJ-954]|nr:hypothetical protein BJF89_16935 [Corynebacterium sp. CNJ-954]
MQHLTALAAPEALPDWRVVIAVDTAVATGILDALPGTSVQIAERTHTHVDGVSAVLSVLASRGMVVGGAVWSVGPEYPDRLERAALVQHAAWIRRWADLVPKRVRDRRATSPTEPARPSPAAGLALLESAVQPYVKSVVNLCLEGAAVPPYPRRVLDLGGGHGAYAVEFARRGCDTVLQDLPSVVHALRTAGATRRLDDAGVRVVARDAFDGIGEDDAPFDLVLCGTLTNIFSLDRMRNLLHRIHGRLAVDGQLAVATWMRDRGPVGAAFGLQMLVATPEGNAHSWPDYREACADAGYSDCWLVEVGTPPLGVILARR